MIILAIETSCDDSAVSIVEARGGWERPHFTTRAELVSSQTKIHAHWGGVVPMLAKREHGRNLIPLLRRALKEAGFFKGAKLKAQKTKQQLKIKKTTQKILEREPELLAQFEKFIPTIVPPKIDLIAVTYGPGLEPTLWVGLNLAHALGRAWKVPVLPINHLEGHLLSPLANNQPLKFPALALIVSGGHTELILARDWLKYEIIGQTRDDAVGEAFDKVARLLGLPYPGGPAISKLAKKTVGHEVSKFGLPRPMINSGDLDFSFSGLKTAVLYLVKKIPKLTPTIKAAIAREFQQAAIDVLLKKTLGAADQHQPQTLIVAGGVAANQELRQQFSAAFVAHHPEIKLVFPSPVLSTDNATMIAAAGYIRALAKPILKMRTSWSKLTAAGNLRLS